MTKLTNFNTIKIVFIIIEIIIKHKWVKKNMKNKWKL